MCVLYSISLFSVHFLVATLLGLRYDNLILNEYMMMMMNCYHCYYYGRGLKAILPITTHYHSVVCPSVGMLSVMFMHPAKAIGWSEMPFGSDT